MVTAVTFIDRPFTSPLLFWKEHGIDLHLLSRMTRCYVSDPAISVKSESCFSISAYYGRKER